MCPVGPAGGPAGPGGSGRGHATSTNRLLTWVFTVPRPMNRRVAISSLDSPSATSPSTSVSRGVSSTPCGSTMPVPGSGTPARRVSSLRVTAGARSASPRATVRTASCTEATGASFNRNPLAPLRIARQTYSSRSNVVRTTMRTAVLLVMRRVASSPSMTGIRMSRSITSGQSVRASSTAATPLSASPTTSRSSARWSMPRSPTRTSGWSSTTATRIMSGDLSGHRGRGSRCGPAR